MNCKETCKRLSAYVDNELNATDKESVERHLLDCAECRRELATLRAQEMLLKAVPAVEPSSGFRARFWQKVREEELKPALRSVWQLPVFRWVPVPLVSAAAVVIFSLFTVFSPLVYAANNPAVKQRAMKIAADAFTGYTKQKVFSPLNFVEFCDSCHHMLCKDCRAGQCSQCPECANGACKM